MRIKKMMIKKYLIMHFKIDHSILFKYQGHQCCVNINLIDKCVDVHLNIMNTIDRINNSHMFELEIFFPCQRNYIKDIPVLNTDLKDDKFRDISDFRWCIQNYVENKLSDIIKNLFQNYMKEF